MDTFYLLCAVMFDIAALQRLCQDDVVLFVLFLIGAFIFLIKGGALNEDNKEA